jgi:hypothetical protein
MSTTNPTRRDLGLIADILGGMPELWHDPDIVDVIRVQ